MCLIPDFNLPHCSFIFFQSQTEDNPSSKMDLSVGVYPPTECSGIGCCCLWSFVGIPALFELEWVRFLDSYSTLALWKVLGRDWKLMTTRTKKCKWAVCARCEQLRLESHWFHCGEPVYHIKESASVRFLALVAMDECMLSFARSFTVLKRGQKFLYAFSFKYWELIQI